MIRVIHYLNQFFGQIGGEEKAGIGPKITNSAVGPGMLIDRLLEGRGKVIATVICGDNYFTENGEEGAEEVFLLIPRQEFDIFIAGPAFNAGRYGLACGELCKRVTERLGLPAVTGMFPENPAVELYKKSVYIIGTTGNAAGMSKAIPRMVNLALKLLRGEPVGKPEQEGYIPQGIKKNVLSDKLASERAIEVLLKKLRGEPFETEIPFRGLDLVPPAPPIERLEEATIALVTEGGLVPKGNPDGLESARATRYARYLVKDLEMLGSDGFQSIHRGFDTTFINEDPNRLIPLDALRRMERNGVFKRLFSHFFVTTGVATTIDNAKKIGKQIATELVSAGVSGAIVTST